ncbi:MFS transporter [Nonomuraea sp. NPDC046570]|uniref:MFS transporter n=1 Tax=Nonomuraea sp. NPDC046570 TaxID=3155255 RepID=UPI0034082B69
MNDSTTTDMDALRAKALGTLGLGNAAETPPPLRRLLRTENLPWTPMLVIGLLAVVDSFANYAFLVLAPDIARTLGFGMGTVTVLLALKSVAIGVAPLPTSAWIARWGRRALLAGLLAVIGSLIGLGTAFVVVLPAIVIVQLLAGLANGAVSAVHAPLLSDNYPPAARVRVQAVYSTFVAAGVIVAPLLIALLAGPLNLTWRGILLVLGTLGLIAAASALVLRDPGFGRLDGDRMRGVIAESTGGQADEPTDSPTPDLRLGEALRRLMVIPTVKRVVRAQAVFGMVNVPFQAYLFYYLDDRWNLAADQRGLFLAGASVLVVAATLLFGRLVEPRFRRDPSIAMRWAGVLVVLGVVLSGIAVLLPWFWPMAVLFSIGFACVGLMIPAVTATTFTVTPSELRPHASALLAIALGAVGGTAGALLLSGLDQQIGLSGAIAALALPGAIAGFLIVRAGGGVAADLEAMVDGAVERGQLDAQRRSGTPAPLLACRAVEFSYGPVQVLHGVDLTVREGEMVALLGTNGAGKSTLMKVIAGLAPPDRGSVRLGGLDVTYVDAERRSGMGVMYVPGGRSVFPTLTVHEHLRLFARPLGGRAAAQAGIDRALAAFNDLAELLDTPAGALSGGQRQMLGVARAHVTRPRLLLIDELSIGLSPKVVGELVTQLRAINEEGTAVVLIEQSANLALNCVEHAYFMERGRIRFDGRAKDLLGRDDLLRAVFLDGAEAVRT